MSSRSLIRYRRGSGREYPYSHSRWKKQLREIATVVRFLGRDEYSGLAAADEALAALRVVGAEIRSWLESLPDED